MNSNVWWVEGKLLCPLKSPAMFNMNNINMRSLCVSYFDNKTTSSFAENEQGGGEDKSNCSLLRSSMTVKWPVV